MTRRDRLENKLEKRQEWAGKAEGRAEQRFGAAHKIADGIPFGQPILVGHHSEGHARRDQDRIYSNMSKGVEESRLAEHHAGKANGLAHQLDHTIFSDDPDAIEQIEKRIAEREAQAAQMVARNAAWRKAKGDVTLFAKLADISEAAAQGIARDIEKAYSWEKQPYAAYQLSNLRGNIRRDKERLKEIKVQAERSEKAEAAPDGVTVEGDEWVAVTFADKPERSMINALKDAGFGWRGGSWIGRRANLPEGIEPVQ